MIPRYDNFMSMRLGVYPLQRGLDLIEGTGLSEVAGVDKDVALW